jgi:hypothetical protein
MATQDKNILRDGFLELSGGVDSSQAPNLLKPNQSAFANNTIFRGGWAYPRSGWKKCTLTFSDSADANFHEFFQGSGTYQYDDGNGILISAHGGRLFRFKLSERDSAAVVSDISIASDLNPPNRDKSYFCQAENYMIVQDGQSLPIIYNGAVSRRSDPTKQEVPVGAQMGYCMGRLVVAQGQQYTIGDLVYGTSGTVANYYRDSVLKFTENTFLNEGGSFGVPLSCGEITALQPIANINTVLGQSEIAIFTKDAVFSNQMPFNRDSWKNLNTPLQRVLQINYGAESDRCVVPVNGDLFYRSHDGIRSLVFAVRNFSELGNLPISGEMGVVLDKDTEHLLPFASGVVFDNRFFTTVSPVKSSLGVYHRALLGIDFDPISGIANRTNPAWQGIFTGINVLQILTITHLNQHRCFMFALNAALSEIELWEMTSGDEYGDGPGDKFDNSVNPIQWTIESRAMNFGSQFDMKRLHSSDIFVDRVSGECSIEVEYRPDSYACWATWDTFEFCATNKQCVSDFGECPTLSNIKEQYQTKIQLTSPPDEFNPVTKQLFKTGYEFQVRLKCKGFFRIKQCRFNAYMEQESPYGNRL